MSLCVYLFKTRVIGKSSMLKVHFVPSFQIEELFSLSVLDVPSSYVILETRYEGHGHGHGRLLFYRLETFLKDEWCLTNISFNPDCI